jgi:hypothetical protein
VFDMDALDYGIFSELLRKGIQGRVTLSEGTAFSASVDVSLKLDDLVSNGVQIEPEGFSTVAEMPGGGEGTAPRRSVRLRNVLGYPARLSRLAVTCIDRSRVGGWVYDAEPLELLPTEQVLAARDDPAAAVAYEVKPSRLGVWNDTAVTLGTVKVDGGSVQDWLDRVVRDTSLEPQRYSIPVIPGVPNAAIRVVRLKLFAQGQPGVRQQQNLAPGVTTDFVIEVGLADLTAARGKPLSFVLEYDCEYAAGGFSLPQRVEVGPSVRQLVLPVLLEQPKSVYRVDHGLPGQELTVDGRLDRSAAEAVVDQARTRGELWQVYLTTA